jgi:hypothetical protein
MHMSKKVWVWGIVGAIIVAGAAFWSGMTYAESQRSTVTSRLGTASATFAGRGGAGFAVGGAGGGTIGTIIQVGNGTFTVQLPTSTSTSATTGTKLVLVDNATQIQALETVPVSTLQVGQTVTVAGATNSDGSITASNIMIRPAARTGSTGTQTTGQ